MLHRNTKPTIQSKTRGFNDTRNKINGIRHPIFQNHRNIHAAVLQVSNVELRTNKRFIHGCNIQLFLSMSDMNKIQI